MGRLSVLILIIALIFCGCGVVSPDYSKPMEFYYLAQTPDYSIGSVYIVPETREGLAYKENLTAILNDYLKGPLDKTSFATPFHRNTYVYSISTEGEILDITLSTSFATLRGMKLTQACACLAMTCLELTDANTVRIRANGTSLDGAEFIEMSAESILLLDSSGTKE